MSSFFEFDEELQRAAANNQHRRVRALIESGANVDVFNAGGYRPLHSAVANGNEKIVSLLLDAGASTVAESLFTGTPLHHIGHGKNICDLEPEAYKNIIRMIVGAGYPLEYKDRHGDTVLQLYVKMELYDLAAELVKLGASTKGVDVSTTSDVFNRAVRQKQQEKSVQAAVRFTRRRARHKGVSR